jgi:ketosteroid isomerase-like protein
MGYLPKQKEKSSFPADSGPFRLEWAYRRAVDQHKTSGQPNPSNGPEGELAQNPAVDEFFTRLSHDMRHPKPGQEGIAAALQAIQRLALEADVEGSAGGSATSPREGRTCQVCGALNRAPHRFCATCGVALEDPSRPDQPSAPASNGQPAVSPQPQGEVHAPGEHHYHHHYHHHYFSGDGMTPSAPSDRPAGGSVRDGRTRAPLNGPSLSRAEAAVRQLTQDLALACNTKQLDDLVELYGADALVLRPNLPAVRGSAAIREFFCAALDGGLGEVEMEPLRTELLGDLAYEAGRCKMLVPIAMGKRREERGKYLIVSARQATGEWKAVADCWSSDLSLGVAAEAKPANAPGPLSRPPRKNP